MSPKTFIQILTLFSSLSLLSIGGGNTVIPEMHLKAVNEYGWLGNSQFSDIFAISQAAPGPSVLIVTLVGYKAGLGIKGPFGLDRQLWGIFGAILATAAMMIPAGILVYLVAQVWGRLKDSPIRKAIEKGFAPLTVGLVLASGYVMGITTDLNWHGYLLTGICTVIFVYSKINPIIIVALAGVIGWMGWLS